MTLNFNHQILIGSSSKRTMPDFRKFAHRDRFYKNGMEASLQVTVRSKWSCSFPQLLLIINI